MGIKQRVMAFVIMLIFPTRIAVILMLMVSNNLMPTQAHPYKAAKGLGQAFNLEQGLIGRAQRIFINPLRIVETSKLFSHQSAIGWLPWSLLVQQLPTGRHTLDLEMLGSNSSRCLSLWRTLVHCWRSSHSSSLGQHMLGV